MKWEDEERKEEGTELKHSKEREGRKTGKKTERETKKERGSDKYRKKKVEKDRNK